MSLPVITADFNNADVLGRLRLNLNGPVRDVQRLGLRLENGLRIVVSDHDELEADGEVMYSEEEHIWVAKIDWNAFRDISRPA
jgi:hypothetical protein